MTSDLIDPGLVIPTSNGDPAKLAEFWEELITWERAGRATIGWRSYEALTDFYTVEVPRDRAWIPAGLSASVHRVVLRLLGKIPDRHSVLDSKASLSAARFGNSFHTSLLIDDLVGAGPNHGVALSTSERFWNVGVTDLICESEPPLNVVLVFDPNSPTAEERDRELATELSGRKIVFVGGQVDSRLIENLSARLGKNSNDFDWRPSEKNKPPRNLDKLVSGAASSGAIIVCITGKIGHSESISLRESCKTKKVTFLWVESATESMSALLREFVS